MGVWCPDESTYFSTYRHHLLVVHYENKDFNDVTLSASDWKQMKTQNKKEISENGLWFIIKLNNGHMFTMYLILNIKPDNI